ncbi:MAG: radical SAM protein [Muribaculaceae bacterium]|nr:radical SAM protein [Muribaculaceae bacterium]
MLFRQLIDIGAIIEDNTDEVQILRQRIDEVDKDDRVFHLTVNPTLDCNFNCWYCYENHQKGSMMKEDTLKSIEKFVKNTIASIPHLESFRLSFFGGEPLMGLHIIKRLILAAATECKANDIHFHVSFTSNAFLLNDETIDFLKNYDISFQITLDGGKEQHDKIRFAKGGLPSYDTIIGHVKHLLTVGISVILRINYTSETICSVREILSILKAIPNEYRTLLTVDLQRVWQDRRRNLDNSYTIAKHLRNEIRSMGYRVHNARILNGVNNSCYGDKLNHLLINYNGDTFRCTARDFNSAGRTGYIKDDGSVTEDNRDAKNWMTAKFSKAVCHICRIAPLCGGGCRKQAVEHLDRLDCYYGYTSDDINDFILERFEERFLNQ